MRGELLPDPRPKREGAPAPRICSPLPPREGSWGVRSDPSSPGAEVAVTGTGSARASARTTGGRVGGRSSTTAGGRSGGGGAPGRSQTTSSRPADTRWRTAVRRRGPSRRPAAARTGPGPVAGPPHSGSPRARQTTDVLPTRPPDRFPGPHRHDPVLPAAVRRLPRTVDEGSDG